MGIERIGPGGDVARVFVNVSERTVDVAGDGGTLQGFRCAPTPTGARLGPWGTAWFLPDVDSPDREASS